jgi:hypothetical protein
MVLKKTAIFFIALILSMNLIANENAEENIDLNDQCEKQYSICLEKCDQGTNEDSEACYDTCDLKLTDCENKAKSE